MDNIILKHKQLAILYSASTSDEKVLKVGSRNVVDLCGYVFEKYNFCHENTTFGTSEYSFSISEVGWSDTPI